MDQILNARRRASQPETPSGRTRITMITAISMPIWPTIWPCQAFSALRMTRQDRGRHRAEQYVRAPDHHRHERFDDEGDAHRRYQGHGRRVQRAAETGERRAEAEAHRIDAGGADAQRARHPGVLHGRPGEHAEARPHEEQVHADHHDDGGGEQHQPVGGEGVVADLEAAGRRADAGPARAQRDQHALGHDQADAPGGQDRVERPIIEPVDDVRSSTIPTRPAASAPQAWATGSGRPCWTPMTVT